MRILAVGDAGTGRAGQREVGEAMARLCRDEGCDLVLYLGDNFYPSGVAGVRDPQWRTAFEEPYAGVPVPFFAVLGNHDYGGSGGGLEHRRARAQVAYGRSHPKWRMPERCYGLETPLFRLAALDTTLLVWDLPGVYGAHRSLVRQTLAGTASTWRIAMGHHPWLSDGSHGDAGRYDGRPWPPAASGSSLRSFLDEELCRRADLYLSGHDHAREVLEGPPGCDVLLVVAGTGGGDSSRSLRRLDRALYADQRAGFAEILVGPDAIEVRLRGVDGGVDFTHRLRR